MHPPDKLDTIVVRPRRNSQARLTLMCLGFCGGGVGSFLPWADTMPADVDLAAICYPGRDGRFLDDFAEDWDALAADMTEAVLSAAAEDPYALFGHSMGAWMAFEVAVRIEQGGGPAPELLIVSSANAPSHGLTPRDMFPAQVDTDEQLLGWMRTHGLMPEHVLHDPDLQQMAVELMRADIRVRDTFSFTPGAQVSAALQVLTADDDAVIEPNAGAAWRDLALGDCRHDVLPGGHFYTPEVWSRLPRFMSWLSAAELPSGAA
ncbi:thioesterase II family protein [Streptomyces niveus]|uniref:thioesterase II family protein n=1 Tax=Streptomyces niveus TaxID=193462 RepID=UPI0036A494B9